MLYSLISALPNLESTSPLHIHLTLNLHLDSARLWIRRRLKSLNRILNIEPMRHQPAQIHNPALHQPDGPRPRIRIAVLELEVDFLGAEPHKRQLHLGLADADDKDLASELDAVDGGVDAAFDTRALERNGRLHAAREVHNLLSGILDSDAPLHLECPHAGHQLLCKRQSALVDIRDHDRFRPGRGSAQQRDQSNGSGAANEQRVTQSDARPLHTRERHAQRLEQGSILKAHVANFVAPDGRMIDVPSQ